MLDIWTYCYRNNTMLYPIRLLKEHEMYKNNKSYEVELFGFCYVASKLTGIKMYNREDFKVTLPELYSFCPNRHYYWFPIDDIKSRISILEKIV